MATQTNGIVAEIDEAIAHARNSLKVAEYLNKERVDRYIDHLLEIRALEVLWNQ